MLARLLMMIVTLAAAARLPAGEQPTRIVEYLYDGGGVKKRVSITSFSGGLAIATFSVTGKKPITAEVSAEDFSKIWTAFSSLSQLQHGDITSSKAAVDTDTHHIFFVVEQSGPGSTSRQYAVLAAEAGPEFKAWLRYFEPKEERANQSSQPTSLTRRG